jgi:GT2 family glycosyltransferase/glycosyltransferase involved in cell wall biosynthesis
MNPIVSVIVANHNGERHLAEALRSILAQSLTELEVLFVDDASTDRSVEIAEAIASEDTRVRVLCLASNAGPAAARNRALDVARGTWIAIVDSDDFIHPDRLRRLIVGAGDADIVADDQLIFDDDQRAEPRRLLGGVLASGPSWITLLQYVRSNRLLSDDTPLGYLKPLIRAGVLTEPGIRYNESLRIAEDYDLIVRLMTHGARFRLLPELLYFYRRHSGSISHRLSPDAMLAMIDADTAFRHWAGEHAIAPLRAVLDARIASIHVADKAETAIACLKARRPLAAFSALIAQPGAIPVVARLAAPASLLARMRRRKAMPDKSERPTICVLSRQRLTAGSNGSSAYLLSLCQALRDSGFVLQLVCPSPSVLGRVPVLRVAGDGTLFDRVAIRGTFRIGRILFARDPLVYLRAAVGIADRLARRVGIAALTSLARPAPYSVGLPWTAEDFLFVAAQARGRADIVLADYGFLTPGIPYALRPGATSAVVMHDLFSSRPATFGAVGAADSVAGVDEATEAGLLAGADLVIAIQAEEAAAARRILPVGHKVLVAPMAVDPVTSAQAGEGGGLLFVGSSTAPNVDGMNWFLTEVWPHLRQQYPNLRLNVAGSVCGKLNGVAHQSGVSLLGRVPELAALYRLADVVISPLRAGSGLKIKLVEAMAHGKPVVATTITAQGVEHLLNGAVAIADSPRQFAGEVLHLLAAPHVRAARAEAALDIARRNFSAGTAYGGVVDHLHARHPAALEVA